MNILITGGAGFIGSKLALELVEKGHTVTILDNLSSQIHGQVAELPSSLQGKVRFIKGDVQDAGIWPVALEEQHKVVHLAAETGTGQSMYEVQRYIDVNIGGTGLLLDYLVNQPHQVEKVVVASSRAIYGEGKYNCGTHGAVYPTGRSEQDLTNADFEPKCPICGEVVQVLPTDEESKIHPASVYGITKQNQEQLVLNVCQSIGLPAVAFRYQNVYGPGQSLKNPYTGILSIFSTQIRNNNPISIFEDGKESRDFVYIDDVVGATILGLDQEAANHQVFNVGSGIPTSVMEVAQTLRSLYQSKVPMTITGNFRLGDIRHNYADLNKIESCLGFAPQYDFSTGVRLFVDWVRSQEVPEDGFAQSIQEMKARGLFK